jgi:peptidoglycan/LPS O-acetylase OafA/YrhL
VLLFHVGLPVQSGGPVGVTLFFVLSGYLITSLLIAERRETGRVNLGAFVIRRARRLLPALVAVMVLVGAISIVRGGPGPAVADSVLTLAYVANWARAMGDPMGLWNHAWSLSIEEQFYLVAPPAFTLLARYRHPSSWTVIGVLAGLAIGSTVVRAVLIDAGASDARIYFGTDTRADALLVGCALAATRARWPAWQPGPWIGPAAMVTLLVVASLPMAHPLWSGSGYTIAVVASMGVVVSALRSEQRWTGLASTAMGWIGERSYSLYLVHVPVFMLSNEALGDSHPVVRVGIAVGLSVLLSVILYQYVERPFRRQRTVRPIVDSVGKHDPDRELRWVRAA